jgi:SAM-dependent methyltransferase
MREKTGYLGTAQAFDQVAPGYDAAYAPEGNAVMGWLRQESLTLLREVFPPGSRLVEVGCGTGEEAVRLAAEGRTVLATDISPAMAARTLAKARMAGLSGRVQALALPAGRLSALRPSVPFDGAYASFGSLNCEPDLVGVARGLAHLLRPGTAFVCSVMGRWCPFEMAWFLAHGRPSLAFRRLRGGWQSARVTGDGGAQVDVSVRYLSAADISRIFVPGFSVERTLALALLLPPPYLDHLYRQWRPLFRRLEPWDRRLRGRWPWQFLGDHVALVLRKR